MYKYGKWTVTAAVPLTPCQQVIKIETLCVLFRCSSARMRETWTRFLARRNESEKKIARKYRKKARKPKLFFFIRRIYLQLLVVGIGHLSGPNYKLSDQVYYF